MSGKKFQKKKKKKDPPCLTPAKNGNLTVMTSSVDITRRLYDPGWRMRDFTNKRKRKGEMLLVDLTAWVRRIVFLLFPVTLVTPDYLSST